MTIPRLVWAISAGSALFSATWAQPVATPPTPKPEASATAPTEFTAAAVERAIRVGDPDRAYFNNPENFQRSAAAMPLERLIELLRNDPQFAERREPADAQPSGRPRKLNPLRHRAFKLIEERVRFEDAGLAVTPQQMQQLVPFLIEVGATDEYALQLALSIPRMPEQFVPQIEDLFAVRLRAVGIASFSGLIPEWLTDSRKVVGDALLDAIKHPTLGLPTDDSSRREIDPLGSLPSSALATLTTEQRADYERAGQTALFDRRVTRLNLLAVRLVGAQRLLDLAEADSTTPDVRAAIAAALWSQRIHLDYVGPSMPARYVSVPIELRDRVRATFRSQVIDSDMPLTYGLAESMLGRMIYGFDTPGAIQSAVDDPGRRAEAQAIRAMFEAKPQRLDVSRGLPGGRENLKPKFDQLVAEQPEPSAR